MSDMRRYDYAIQRILPYLWLEGFKGLISGFHDKPDVGDLVMIRSAPDSEWHLSIILGHEPLAGGDTNWLLESMKTGKHCWWSNVGLATFPRKWVEEHPRVLWSDEQFAFARLFEAEHRRADFYIDLPFIARMDGDECFVSVRTRYDLDKLVTDAGPIAISGTARGELRCHLWAAVRAHQRAKREQRALPPSALSQEGRE